MTARDPLPFPVDSDSRVTIPVLPVVRARNSGALAQRITIPPAVSEAHAQDVEASIAIVREAIQQTALMISVPQMTDPDDLLRVWRVFLSEAQRGPTRPRLPGRDPQPRYPLFVVGWYRGDAREASQLRLNREAMQWIAEQPECGYLLASVIRDCAERLVMAQRQGLPTGISAQLPDLRPRKRRGKHAEEPHIPTKRIITEAAGLVRPNMLERYLAESMPWWPELQQVAQMLADGAHMPLCVIE